MNNATALEKQTSRYRKIAKSNHFQHQQLNSAHLDVNASHYRYQTETLDSSYQKLWEEHKGKITKASSGWARSQKDIHLSDEGNHYQPERDGYLIEGEWLLEKNHSLHLRQIHHGWVITHYRESDKEAATLLYQDQHYLNISPQTYLKYRLYYQLGEHSYERAFARFIGFSHSNVAEEARL